MERRVASDEMPEPDQDLAADMYLMAEERMDGQGYRHYEISNWARPGLREPPQPDLLAQRALSGSRAGAHSYLDGCRFWNLRSPKEYIRRTQELAAPPAMDGRPVSEILDAMPAVERSERIDRRLEMAETLMMGLRLETGVGVGEFAGRFGEPPAAVYGDVIEGLVSVGLLEKSDDRLRLTDRGRILGNEVFSRFFS